ncbi:MAG: UpxY family transcription antiterminator [Bryobacterales bacterium]|nr:UpxY family transcription antiterminator [Bryobacterales bacterium]
MLVTDYNSELHAENPAWFAVRVRSNFEQQSCNALNNRGLATFLPSFKRRRRWSDRVKMIDQPLFPGYLFCSFDKDERAQVLRAPGVVHIVSSGQDPLPVNESELHHIRTVVLAEMAANPHPFLKIGQRVRIDRGPLTGAEGILTALDGKSSLILSISLLQRSIAVEVNADWVRGL